MGRRQWHKCYGGKDADGFRGIIKNKTGGYLLMGGAGSIDGDVKGNHGNAISRTADIWVVCISNIGNIQWQKCYGGSETETGFGIDALVQGGYVIAGQTFSTDGDITEIRGGISAGLDGWVLIISETGELQWQRNCGGSAEDRLRSVAHTSNGGFVAVGETNSNDDDITYKHPPAYYPDVLLMQFTCTQCLNVQSIANALTIYPNPATDYITINGTKAKYVEIVDLLGNIKLSCKIYTDKTTIAVNGLPTGLSLIHI